MKHPISLILAIATGLMALASPQSHAQAIETEPAGSQEGPPPEPQAPPVVTEQSVDEAIQVIRSRAATIGTPQGLSQLPGLQGESPQEVGASMVRQITSRQRQVHDLAWPLLVGGSQAGLCKSAWKTGLLLSTFLPSKGEALVETVASGSPASEAGLRENDAITAIGGKQVRSIKVAQGQLEKASETPTAVQLSVRRGGERFTVAVAPVKACDLEVGVFDGSNSFMDTGTTGVIQIDPNAWQAVQSDQDRQIIIAHQVGHHWCHDVPRVKGREDVLHLSLGTLDGPAPADAPRTFRRRDKEPVIGPDEEVSPAGTQEQYPPLGPHTRVHDGQVDAGGHVEDRPCEHPSA